MLCGLLGNIGIKSERRRYLVRAVSVLYRHPGARLSKKPGRWIVAAELVETTRLFRRGIANIEPQWVSSGRPPFEEAVAGPALGKNARR